MFFHGSFPKWVIPLCVQYVEKKFTQSGKPARRLSEAFCNHLIAKWVSRKPAKATPSVVIASAAGAWRSSIHFFWMATALRASPRRSFFLKVSRTAKSFL
jgi:hypothetical protein